ncbi:putative enzyme related to lactoylglutathione lyase [Streptacidiphilus sp. MAP12-16]|uniref:VOC family protein n=1 Tax=Streptacidiphilus sp. MAP12-16 TaxID=3156300 RepID=UPI0035142CB5
MPEINAPYAPGTPCWIDLMAKDQRAAMDFYQDLFGWQGEVGPDEFGGYAIMHQKGRPVCGIGPAMAPEGMPEPPHVWTTYLSSDDADATAQKMTDAHGTVMMPPMDVGTLGRMFVASDPAGAVVGVWGHKDFFGAGLVNEHGALIWNECNTRDVPAASAFYTAALGIAVEPMEGMPGYFGLNVAGRTVGGLQDMAGKFPDEVPPHWMSWFAVDDTDSVTAAHVKAGGNVVVAPSDTPAGRMAGLQDPWGAVFCVLQPSAPSA